MIYSKLPLWYHLMGLVEIGLQTLTFSLVLLRWERRATDLRARRARHARAGAPRPTEFAKASMAACFAWIGYAVGALLSARLVRHASTSTGRRETPGSS